MPSSDFVEPDQKLLAEKFHQRRHQYVQKSKDPEIRSSKKDGDESVRNDHLGVRDRANEKVHKDYVCPGKEGAAKIRRRDEADLICFSRCPQAKDDGDGQESCQ